MSKYKNVTVIMITKNEEGSVARVIKDIKRDVLGAEILVVDSSSDQTPVIAKKNGAKVIRQFPPKGYGPAMMKALLTPKRDIIVTLDCDNTYPTKIIPLLVKKISEGYDLVGTDRMPEGKPRYMPWSNYVMNRLFNLFASILFFRKIRDVHSGMRAYKRELLHNIDFEYKASALPVELLLKPIGLGYKCIEIPIKYNQRTGFTTLDRFNSTLWTFKRILKCRFMDTVF